MKVTAAEPMHALGDLTYGAYLFTFGMPVLATRADRIVRDIAATVDQHSRTGAANAH